MTTTLAWNCPTAFLLLVLNSRSASNILLMNMIIHKVVVATLYYYLIIAYFLNEVLLDHSYVWMSRQVIYAFILWVLAAVIYLCL